MLSEAIVREIVKTAHDLGRRVIAHVGEQKGFERALAGGVDEFAHMPCAEIKSEWLKAAANTPDLTFVTTVDTLSSCVDVDKTKSPPVAMGIHSNTMQLANLIEECEEHTPGNCAQIIYGSEVAHDNVPWGINGEELHMMLYLTHGKGDIEFNDVVNVFRAATSEAGEHLDIPGLHDLGKLTPGAPADIIAVRGNPFEKFKLLEYPDLVMSGGHIVVNKFSKHH